MCMRYVFAGFLRLVSKIIPTMIPGTNATAESVPSTNSSMFAKLRPGDGSTSKSVSVGPAGALDPARKFKIAYASMVSTNNIPGPMMHTIPHINRCRFLCGSRSRSIGAGLLVGVSGIFTSLVLDISIASRLNLIFK